MARDQAGLKNVRPSRARRLIRVLAIASSLLALALGGGVMPAAAQFPGALNISLQATPTNVQVGQIVTFSASASPPSVLGGTITSLFLDFGDGTTADLSGFASPGQTVTRSTTHAYANPGLFFASLAASASNGSSNSDSQAITVGGGGGIGPIGGLTVTLNASPSSAQAGQLVTFSGSASPPSVLGGSITNIQLNFGDGTTADLSGFASPGQTVQRTTTHSYSAGGTYTAILTASASNGSTNSATQTVFVSGSATPQPPSNIQILNPPVAGQVGQSVNLSAATAFVNTPGASIQSYSWSFGDGGTSIGQSVSHVYTSPGGYTITLTVTDTAGGSGQTSTRVQISSASPPPGPSTSVTLSAGWNLVAMPNGSTIPVPLGPIYTYQAGNTAYQVVQNGQQGLGYWVFLNSPVTETIPLNGPQTYTTSLPPGQFVMVGNPGSTVATVSGADIVYSYNASTGYQQTSTLQPGQGAWVISLNGGTVTISSS